MSLATISPPVGDGASSAVSTGSGGGLVGVVANTAKITANPTVGASVTAALITTTGDVSISSSSVTKTTVSSQNGTGGFVAVGTADAHSFQTNKSSASVGASTRIVAGGSFALAATSTSQTDASSRATASGAVGVAYSDTDASVDYVTSTTIGAGVDVQAANLVKVSSQSNVDAATKSFADGSGFGADGDSDSDMLVGKGASGAKTSVDIGANAALVAKRVLIEARAPRLHATARGEAYGSGFYSEGTNDSSLNIDAENSVAIGANVVVTGLEGVDVSTRFDDVNHGVGNTVDAFGRATGLFGTVRGSATNNTDLESTFDSAAGATITAGPRDPGDAVLGHPDSTDLDRLAFFVDNANGLLNDQRDGHDSKRSLASGSGSENGYGIKTNAEIDFDSNVVILSGRSPLLIVNSCGAGCATIATAINVSVWDGSGSPAKTTGVISSPTIYVNDIVNRTPGQVYFRTYNDASVKGLIGGGETAHSIATSGTWEFRGGFEQVVIVNNSDKPLEVHSIRVFNDPSDILSKQPLARLEAFDDAHITLTFNLRRTIAPSLVRVQSTNAAATATITLAGLIDNPIGTTVIQNLGGAGVLSASARDVSTASAGDLVTRVSLVRTNILDLESATQSVGTAAARVNVDVVDVAGRPAATTFATGRVSSATDAIYIGPHAFFSGQAVRYHAASTVITGLTNDAIYIVIAVDARQIQLASMSSPTTPLALDTAGLSASAQHTLTPVQRFTALTPSGSIYLDVKARLRGASVTNYKVAIDAVRAGVDADLLLQAAEREGFVSGNNGGVMVEHPGEGTIAMPSGETHYTFYNLPDPIASRPLPDVGVFGTCDATTTCPEVLDTTYVLKARDGASLPTLPGVTAGGSIILKGAPPADDDAPLVIIDAILEIHGSAADTEGAGWIDALTNGDITLEEYTNNLHVGHIESTLHDVTLTAPRAILDWHSITGEVADVIAVSITMTAGMGLVSGGIGTPENFLEIDVDAVRGAGGVLTAYDAAVNRAISATEIAACGTLSSTRTCGIFLTDTHADLPVDTVYTTADASLVTTDGSILDGLHASGTAADAAEIFATSIDLRAGGDGSVGTSTNDVEIDSSYRAAGDVGLQAGDSVYVTEVDSTLHLVLAEADGGDVRVTVRETDPDATPSSATLDEDLDLLHDGAVRFDEGVLQTVPRGRVAALEGYVLLLVGDSVTTSPNSEIRAGESIEIYGDWTNADAGYGTTIVLRGDIVPGALFATRVFGDTDVDVFQLGDASGAGGGTAIDSPGYIKLGGITRIYGSEDLSAAEPDGEDVFTVDYLQTMNVAAGHTLTLDGEAESDTYTISSTGSQGSARNYVINVLDTGASDDGVDELAIYGTSTNDIFLLRRVTQIAGEAADRPAFVALLHGSLDGLRDTIAGNETSASAQRVNYDTAVNGRVQVLGLGGNDYFASDDNSATTTLDGGAGADTFQIGQLFGTKRDVAAGGVAAADVFPVLIATTRGWLSPGISAPLVAVGGSGDDEFSVYANQAELRLEGDDGNDFFTVRAFALAAVVDTDANGDGLLNAADLDNPTIDRNGDGVVNAADAHTTTTPEQWQDDVLPLDAAGVARPVIGLGFSTARPLDIRTGGGEDEVQYSLNAPVSIDGGAGFDKVAVLGTEFPDDIVITAAGIFGAGSNASIASVEAIEVDGLEGDDEFFVRSTAFDVSYRVVGGLGSDSINVAGDVVEDIVVRELEGASGAVDHLVTSTGDLAFDGLIAPGLDVHVAGVNEGIVVIDETDGLTAVREGGTGGVPTIDSYGVRLSRAPVGEVYVTVSAARSPQEESSGGPAGDTVWLCSAASAANCDAIGEFQRHITVNGAAVDVPQRALVLVFDASNWSVAQAVYMLAVDDLRAEGDRVVTLSHTTIAVDLADKARFDHAAVRNVELTVRDNDAPGVVVVQVAPGTSTEDVRSVVLEGDGAAALSDELLISLPKAPLAGMQVVVRLDLSNAQISLSSSDSRWNGALRTITFTSANWFSPVRVLAAAVQDSRREDPALTVLTVKRDAATTDAGYLFDDRRIGVEVLDDDTAGVVVVESGGSTLVTLGGPDDDYAIRLTKAPSAAVRVAVLTDGLTDVKTINGGAVSLEAIGPSYTGNLSFNTAARRITRTDGSGWLAAGFLEGQRISIDGAGNYKIAVIRGTNATQDDTLELSDAVGLPALATGVHTISRIAPIMTFTAADFATARTVVLSADSHFQVPLSRAGVKPFAQAPHFLSSLHGPLAVEGGVSGADRSLKTGVKLAGEKDGPPFAIGAQPPEGQQVDVLNIYGDSSQEDGVGTLSSTNLSGFGMAGQLTFAGAVFGETSIVPAGISFGMIGYTRDAAGRVTGIATNATLSTIEVLNVMLGAGNDRLTIQSTLNAAPEDDRNPLTDPNPPAAHGTITVVHGGGNTSLTLTGAMSLSGSTITRTDGLSWVDAGFAVGQVVTITGVGGPRTINTITGASLTLSTPVGSSTGSKTVAVLDPKTSGLRLGGDTITVTGGAGPGSALVVYGDTSQDALWYSGGSADSGGADFGPKPFDAFPNVADEDERFIFGLASPFDSAGHDVIDARTLFAGLADGSLPTVGLIAYGGGGDDLIYGSTAGDYLAGGSGDDEIHGMRGVDQVYGDNGIDVHVITRELQIPSVDASTFASRDTLVAGKDLLYGDDAGSTASTAGIYDDVIFGDYGIVDQDTLAGAIVGGTPDGYVRSAAKLQKIQTTGRIRDIRTTRASDGADDVIHGNGGRDRIFGGYGADTITGDGESNVVFGDHGHMGYIAGTTNVTILHVVESLDFEQGGIDTITTNGGDDIVAGGTAGDVIDGGSGANVVFGDHGRVTGIEGAGLNRPIDTRTSADDFQVPTFALIETINPAGGGGADVINSGVGRDIIFGGAAGDTIVANVGETTSVLDGNNVVFGDYGFLDYLAAVDNPSPISLDRVWSSDEAFGGADTITTGTRHDFVFGGAGGDTIDAGKGQNIVFGDHGRITGTQSSTLNRSVAGTGVDDDYAVDVLAFVEGYAPTGEFGGVDTIRTGVGADVVFGGAAGDSIVANVGETTSVLDGNNVVFGDYGFLDYLAAVDNPSPTSLDRVWSSFEDLGGADTITTGTRHDFVFGGAGGDTIDAGKGQNIVFGDHGRITGTQSSTLNRSVAGTGVDDDYAVDVLAVVEGYAPTGEFGGVDTIRTGVGADVVFGGAAGDSIVANVGETTSVLDGNNVVFGDYGFLDYLAAVDNPSPTSLDRVWSSFEDLGGADAITTGTRNDFVFGGAGGDTITADKGQNIVFGDHGRITGTQPLTQNRSIAGLGIDDDYAVDVLAFVEGYAPTGEFGGVDTIRTGVGADVVFGGAAGDSIVANVGETASVLDGNNVVFGDYGFLDYLAAYNPSPVSLDRVWSTFEDLGGADTITTGTRNDFAFGGTGGDVIDAGKGQNIVFGDHGRITGIESTTFNRPILDSAWPDHDDYPIAVLQLVEGYVPADGEFGGNDTINTGVGRDIVFGGGGGDTIVAKFGETFANPDHNNIVFGDYGFVDYVVNDGDGLAGADPADNPHDIDRVWSDDSALSLGGDDTITTGVGSYDIIIGGTGDDTITTGANRDLAFGDNAKLTSAAGVNPNTIYSVHEFSICVIETVGFGDGDAGDDTIYGSPFNDILFGGGGDDVIYGYEGNDLIFGDQGRVSCVPGTSYNPDDPRNGVCVDLGGTILFVATNTTTLTGSGDDLIYAGAGDDIVMGQQGDDIIYGGDGDDLLIGGSNVAGALDGDDVIDGGTGNDAIAGDNAECCYRYDLLDPRFQTLLPGATTIYGTSIPLGNDGLALVSATPLTTMRNDPTATGATCNVALGFQSCRQYRITLLDHSDTIESTRPDLWGDDYIAGGWGADEIFGGLGADVIQGDGYVDGLVFVAGTYGTTAGGSRPVLLSGGPAGLRIGAWRTATPTTDTDLVVHPSLEDPANDGDDYIEGNGGDDVIFGGLGQDDIVGDSSDLYGLTAPNLRPVGSDLVFGGAGVDIARNVAGDAQSYLDRYARDADVIAGDNAQILRLVRAVAGTPGTAFLTFAYDAVAVASDPRGTLRIIPRAVRLLDYTQGGPAFNAVAAASDRGKGDELHGESGDDVVYGMRGNDVMFGEGQNDDLIGGYGDDWISGGTGDDGVIGDDGRISTSRNSATFGEPLYGVSALRPAAADDTKLNEGDVLNEFVYTPGKIQTATINVEFVLKKSVNLTPFNVDPADDPLFRPAGGYDDIVFGGLGDDALHGGSGDDALSGAEALVDSSAQLYNSTGALIGTVRSDYGHPVNPGDALRFNPDDVDGWHADRSRRSGEFALYDEYDPLRKILLNADGTASKTGAGKEFFLNFVSSEGIDVSGCVSFTPSGTCTGTATVKSDGNDVIFGDLGNDWLVGGTGRDDLYAGYGNDLSNVDDELGTAGGLNNVPDTHPNYEDRAYGGAGRDVLIANTGGDRLIDWVGEFNSYLVPFAPFGMATVSRTLQPQLAEFLYALSESDGVDMTRQPDTGNLPAFRNGEPDGELGVVRQQDFDWHDQTGGPTDPQAGNIPGGKRDVLRSASFNDNTLSGFAVDSGTWQTSAGALQVGAESLGKDAAAVFNIPDYLPVYFEVQASISVIKPIAGWKANSYIIFDYEGPTAFKFAGIDISVNKLVMGHRDATGWVVDVQTPFIAKPDTYYNLVLAVNGLAATLLVNNSAVFTHVFPARVLDGYSYGLNYGFVGFGSDNSRGSFDNITVQVLPPQITHDATEGFDAGAGAFAGQSGTWSAAGGRYGGTAAAGTTAISTLDLGLGRNLASSSYIGLDVTLSTTAVAGVAFDVYAANDFKFVVLDVPGQRVLVGHVDPRRGWTVDSTITRALTAGANTTLTLDLQGSVVTVSAGGLLVTSFAYNGAVADGAVGTLVRGGSGSFDSFRLRTNDAAFGTAPPPVRAVSIADASTAEGNTGSKAVTLTLTLSSAAVGGETVAWATSNGSATAGSDYTAASGTVTFATGATSATISVTVLGDTTVEGNESFTVTLSSPTGGLTLGTSSATVMITNDDVAPARSVSIAGASTTEGNSGSKTITLTLTLSAAAVGGETVAWATSNGTATAGSDYTAASGTVTFAAGATSATISVTVLGDSVVEANETFTVTLSNPTGGLTLGTSSATATITNDDVSALPAVSVVAGSPNASEAGPVAGSFTLTRSGATTGALAVKLTWSGSATFSSDYTLSMSGATLSADRLTLTFAAGSASATITVTPVADSVVESSETVVLTVASGTGYSVGSPASATVTIADAPPPPLTLSVADASIVEGDTKTSTLTVAVTLSRASTSAVTVVIATQQIGTGTGLATAGTDYHTKTATLTFAAGQTSATFAITIVNDRLVEGNETFRVVLSSPGGGATIARGTATLTITDNDTRLMATAAGPEAGAAAATIDAAGAQPALRQAIGAWVASGFDAGRLTGVSIRVADLDGEQLAYVDGNVIVIDRDAAGWGWHTGLRSLPPANRIDLLTVLVHELGHVLGLEHDDEGVMAETLGAGARTVSQGVHTARRIRARSSRWISSARARSHSRSLKLTPSR